MNGNERNGKSRLTGDGGKTKTKMSKEDKKERSLFEEIEQGKNRFTLDDPMGKLVKEAFDLTQLAKKLKNKK